MQKNTVIDDAWLNELMLARDIDPLMPLPPMLPEFSKGGNIVINLCNRSFVSLFDLLTLYLIVDFCQACQGVTNLRFTGLGPHEVNTPFLEKKIYDEIRAKRLDIRSIQNGEKKYENTDVTYRFLGFFHNFGFFDALGLQNDANRVVFEGIDKELLQNLYHYAGVRSNSSKVVPMLPIRRRSPLDSFMSREVITSWVEQLPQNIREAPVFADGEFSRVLGYQLVMNIIEHAGSKFEGIVGALGAIAMRVIASENFSVLKNTFPGRFQHLFNENENSRGLLEICVGDRGAGIAKTLTESYKNIMTRSGKKVSDQNLAVIAYAFDEVGSRKSISERLGGVHALHRILRCTIKYHGLLRLRTAGFELIYDAKSHSSFERGDLGLGIKPSHVNRIRHPWGTQIQILLPLSKPLKNSATIVPRGTKRTVLNYLEPNARIVAVAAYFQESKTEEFESKFDTDKLAHLAGNLMIEPAYKLIVYDLGGGIWKEQDIVEFLQTQKSVLHTHVCIGVNCHAGLAKSLRDREMFESSDWPEWREDLSDLFDVLSTKHRLFVLLDNNHQVTWLGLGKYKLDDGFQYLLSIQEFVDFDDIIRRVGIQRGTRIEEILFIYLDANKGLFESRKNAEGTGMKWQSKLSYSVLFSLEGLSVSTAIGDMLERLKCVHNKGLYKLPSKFEFTKRYYQSTPLFQDRIASQQLAEWMASAIRDKLDNDEKKLLLVCSTAPVELAALQIANSMISHDVFVLNLGYYSYLDRENILNATDWNLPTFILADIIDSGNTVEEIINLLNNFGLPIKGIIALIRFSDNAEENIFRKGMFWNSIPGREKFGNIPTFYVTETKRPELVSEQQAWNLGESNLFFIEPFSLEFFDYESLSRSNPKKGRRASVNVEDLLSLEKIDSLRYGHLVYGTHHFIVSVDIKRLLSSDEVLGPIISKLMNICQTKKISHVLFPLHSNIGRILPKISAALSLHYGVDLDYTFCVSTKTLTERPFYLLPTRIKNAISSAAEMISRGGDGIRFLILDDAVSSGRTLETIIRAIVLECREVAGEKNLTKCPVEMVYVFSILDRQGIAKGTLIQGIDKISIRLPSENSRKNDAWSFEFSYDRWLALDMPVTEAETCEVCNERRYLTHFIETDQLPDNHSAILVLRKRIEELKANSTESPAFIHQQQQKLPTVIKIGRVDASTFELAYLEFLSQIQSGYPMHALIKQYKNIFTEDLTRDIQKYEGLALLQQEMLRTFIKKWQMITSQWTGLTLKEELLPIIREGSDLARVILIEAGYKMGERNAKTKVLRELFEEGITALVSFGKVSDNAERKQENLYIGCLLFYLLYVYRKKEENFEPSKKKHKDIEEQIFNFLKKKIEQKSSTYSSLALRNLSQIVSASASKDTFLPSFYFVLDHTIRAARSTHHSYLIPVMLKKLVKEVNFSNRDYRILLDTLSYFNRCMKLVVEKYPELLDPIAEPVYKAFMHYLHKLMEVLGRGESIQDISRKVKYFAPKVKNLFPYQVKNPLFQKLADTQVSLFNVLKSIESRASAENILIKFDENLEAWKSIYIIARNRELIEGILDNYILKTGANQPGDKKLICYITLDVKQDVRRVKLTLRTNYRDYDYVSQKSLSGSGMTELGARDLELFKIEGSFKVDKHEKEGILYKNVIVLEFCLGFELPKYL
jgi:adenine/guanine phosphoribosyltransferase-like PRPP-binding protein